jgi:glycosyltransferase involved in cell wall biosynthesis
MPCPTLKELPPPQADKTGWPWTEETPVPPLEGDGNYARISIVTPCFNSIRYLEETIRSVLLQGYPDLEYIVIDGGSTDGSVEVIRKYEKWLSFWISERDRGYADAVNKGFAQATGDVRAWIPASDLYTPSAFFVANRYLGTRQTDLIFGRPYRLSEDGNIEGISPVETKNLRHVSLYGRSCPNQATTFWRREIHKQAGQLNADLRLAADSEWFLRLSLIGRCRWIPEIVCRYRQHSGQLSTNLEEMTREWHAAWDAVVRAHRIPRLKILLCAVFVVPLMRYRSGGLRRLFRIPNKQALLGTIFRRSRQSL